MAGRTTAVRKQTFLPEGVPAAIRRRLIELCGVAMIGAGVALFGALASYAPTDPSLNTASGGPVDNLLGWLGAVVADLLLQSLGLAAALLTLFLVAWGWRLVTMHRLTWPWIRLALAPMAVVSAAIALAAAQAPANWPLAVGLGGFGGGLLLNQVIDLVRLALPMAGPQQVALAVGGLTLIMAYFALGYRLGEWAGGARRIGRLFGRVGRSIGRRGVVRDAINEAAMAVKRHAAGERIEPRIGADARPARKPKPAPELRAPRAPKIATKSPALKPSRRASKERQRSLDLKGPAAAFNLPPLELLGEAEPVAPGRAQQNEDALEQNARILEGVLDDFGVRGVIEQVRPGPVVTLYELEPAPGTKSSRVIGLSDDIARSMSAVSVRIATVPGRNVIGIELPNARRELVQLRDLLASTAYEDSGAKLPLILGKDIGGTPVTADLARMPHLLIAGTTGSGKSVGVNAMILSLLYSHGPDACRFIMIDPKMLELSVYDNIPHLLAPVVTDPKKAVVALKWTVREMEERYRAMSKLGVRNIEGYNKRLADARKKGEVLTRRVQTGFDQDTGQPIVAEQPLDLTPLPYIVVVVDEMADLMLVAGKDIEASIQRLAQMARAAGIHLIMATQRPSVDVITGTIKANFPTRIGFQVTSKIDSRTILGEQGAEQLLGRGDMLYMAGGGRITRVHGPFVDDGEVESVCHHLKSQAEPSYIEGVTDEDDFGEVLPGVDGGGGGSGDELYDRAVAVVAREGKASTSFIQRHLQIGYNRAARIIEKMEKEGVVSKANHVGKREVLVQDHSAPVD